MSRGNLGDETFRLRVLSLRVKNYDSIVPEFEKNLRNRFNPIVGRQ